MTLTDYAILKKVLPLFSDQTRNEWNFPKQDGEHSDQPNEEAVPPEVLDEDVIDALPEGVIEDTECP